MGLSSALLGLYNYSSPDYGAFEHAAYSPVITVINGIWDWLQILEMSIPPKTVPASESAFSANIIRY